LDSGYGQDQGGSKEDPEGQLSGGAQRRLCVAAAMQRAARARGCHGPTPARLGAQGARGKTLAKRFPCEMFSGSVTGGVSV